MTWAADGHSPLEVKPQGLLWRLPAGAARPWDARPMGRWAGSFDDWPIPGPGPSDCWWLPLAWSSLSPALLFLHLWVSLGLLGSG